MENTNFQNFVLTEIERLDKESKELKTDVNNKLHDIHMAQHNQANTTAQGFNVVHERINIQDGRINFLASQIEDIRKEMANQGKECAKNINIKDITPEPWQGEVEYLNGLLDGKVQAWEAALTEAKSQCLSSFVDSAIDASLAGYNFDRTRHQLNPNDKTSFVKAFANSFTKEALSGPLISSSDPRMIALELGIKGLIMGGKFLYALHKKSVVDKELQAFWEEELVGHGKVIGYEEELESFIGSGCDFREMVKDYEKRYLYNYGRDDMIVSELTNRKFSRIENFD
jgi:hypothetical protein